MSVNAILTGKQIATKELSFTLSLAANGWSNGSQTVSDTNLLANDYVYTISPVPSNFADYGAAGIYADNVTVDGSITFHCNKVPSGKIKVVVLREKSDIIPAFAWGTDGSTADAAWFAALQAAVQDGEADSNWVGLTKSVTLSSAVQGTTTHLIQCIGVNQDGNNTITFQTKNCLIDEIEVFDSDDAVWSTSDVRDICADYYDAFPGKDYIKTVSKGTNTEYNTDSVVYTDETVWLPSIYEVGLGSYEYAPIGAEYTQGCSTPYTYYSSDSTRIKYIGDVEKKDNEAYWWTRSRDTLDSDGVCYIYEDGSAIDGFYADTGFWIAPAFVIG